MLGGDLTWEGCARNSEVVKVIEKHLRGGRRAGTACAKIICRSVCPRQMGLFTTNEDDDSKATRRNKTANTTKQLQNSSDRVVSTNSPGAEGRAEL